MANISITSTENQGVQVLLEGDLLIRDSVEIKQELINLLENHQSIEIFLKNIERVDIIGLQLLISMAKSASEQEKRVRYNFEETEYIRNVLNNSGFNEFFLSHSKNE